MLPELARNFHPVAPPRLIEDAYSEDQYRRLMDVVRQNGPWQLILAENFSTPEEVIAWYYRGRIGGGFNCWPDGPEGEPLQIQAPMWGRGVAVENEMMFHHGQAWGPVAVDQSLAVTQTSTGVDDVTAWVLTDAATATIMRSADALEGRNAFVEMREPNWSGK